MRDALLTVISLAFVVPSRCYGPETQNSGADVNIINYSTETKDYGIISGGSSPAESLLIPGSPDTTGSLSGARYWWQNVDSPFLANGQPSVISVSSTVSPVSSISPVQLNTIESDAGTTGVKVASAVHSRTELLYPNNPFLNGEIDKKTQVYSISPTVFSPTTASTLGERDYSAPGIDPLPSNSIAPSAYPSSTEYAGPTAAPTPYPGCAAALKCVPENYCNIQGFASDTAVVLTKEFLYNRVPLTDCLDVPTGIIGKCCRDPDYKDPWPADLPHEHGHEHGHEHNHEHNHEHGHESSDSNSIQPDEVKPTTGLHVIPISAYQPSNEGSQPVGDYGGVPGGIYKPPSQPPPSPPYGQPQQPSVPSFHPQPTHPPSIFVPPYNPPSLPGKPSYRPQPPQNYRPPIQQPFHPPFIPGSQQPGQPGPSPYPTHPPTQPPPYGPGPSQPPPYPPSVPSQPPPYGPSQPHPGPSPTYPSQPPTHPPPYGPSQPHPGPSPTYPSQPPTHPSQPPTHPPPYGPGPSQPPLSGLSPTYPSQPPTHPPTYGPGPSQPPPYHPSVPSQPPPYGPSQPSGPSSSFPPKPPTYGPGSAQPPPYPPSVPSQPPPHIPSRPLYVPSKPPHSIVSPPYQSSHPPPPSGYPGSSHETHETTVTIINPGSPQYPSSPPTSYPQSPSNPNYPPQVGYPYQPPSQYPYPQQPPSQYPQQPPPSYPQQQYPQPGPYPEKPSQPYSIGPEVVEVTQSPLKYHIVNKFGGTCGTKKDGATAHGNAPWHVIVYSSKNKDLICAGAIVSENAILTAAHCLDHSEADSTEVKIGPQGKIHKVVAIARHSQYEPISFNRDLALVFLHEPIPSDEYVEKICLPSSISQQSLPSKSQDCFVSSMVKDFEEETLQVMPVEVFPYKDCEIKLRNTYLGKYFVLNDSFSCVSTPADKELCSVKTGAPIACSRGDGTYELFGIKSWDLGCQQYKSSAIFSNADILWIQNTLSTPLPKLSENEKARRKDKFKGESLEGININEKPGFGQGYGK